MHNALVLTSDAGVINIYGLICTKKNLVYWDDGMIEKPSTDFFQRIKKEGIPSHLKSASTIFQL